MEDQKYQEWLSRLLAAGLSVEIKGKLVNGDNLTTEEMRQFIRLMAVADEMKSREDSESVLKILKKMNRNINTSLDNEREILYWVSDDKEKYAQQRDLRHPNSFKEAILNLTLIEIGKRPNEERRAIALKFFNEFKGHPDFYDDFKSFMRQIDRLSKRED